MISIASHGLDNTREFFRGLVARLRDLRPAWNRVREDFWLLEREQFETEGKYAPGGHWQALSPRYAAWKAQHYPGTKILELTGRLKRSMTSQTSDTIWETAPDRMKIGTAVPYAAVHQTGGRVPERPFLVVPPERVRGWAVLIGLYLLGFDGGMRAFDRRSIF